MDHSFGRPAGFWIRFGALIIDVIILFIMSYPIKIVLGKIFGVTDLSADQLKTGIPMAYIYNTLFLLLANEALKFFYSWALYTYKGATIGKLVLGLRVYSIKTKNAPNGPQTFLRENLGKFISGILFMIGYLMVGLRGDKKALHDLISDTVVVYADEQS